ncbi:MAG: hypothetical protein PWQ17_35 [Anaerophaga sp.]|nr:hypothetical protein [Anaerophaga sp.]
MVKDKKNIRTVFSKLLSYFCNIIKQKAIRSQVTENTEIAAKKTVLFCPLDWGLGHIARDLPLIKEFSKHGHRVIVAASQTLIDWLEKEFPQVETTLFEGPDIRYTKNSALFLKMIFILPHLFRWLIKEKNITSVLVEKYHPDLIVSDNRYGARHYSVYSVIITHQLMLKMPLLLRWAEYPVYLLIKRLIRPFRECWVPDFEKEHSLAGDLVHKYPLPKNARLIGSLSRFDDPELPVDISKRPAPKSLLAIISGPEPQRSLLEEKLKNILNNYPGEICIVRGTDIKSAEVKKTTQNMKIYNHLQTPYLLKKIKESDVIISRPGYSTIMDMYTLKKSILMIPTPGQTEQEYLAKHHHNNLHKLLNIKHINTFDNLPHPLPPKVLNNTSATKNFREVLKELF